MLGHMAERKKNPHAVALGKAGGKKGGKARWAGVSKEQRREIAKGLAAARWGKRPARRRSTKKGPGG
jgi:hypothetical protein